MRRVAEIRSTGIGLEVGRVRQYLPHNYWARVINADVVEIAGDDVAGWTLDGYVIPRLASGLIFADEVAT